MKILLAVVLALGSANASTGLKEVVETGKRNAAVVLGVQEPHFRSLRVVFAADGKPDLLCGEIGGKNKPRFEKFYVPFKLDPNKYKDPKLLPDQIREELAEAVCGSYGSGIDVKDNPS